MKLVLLVAHTPEGDVQHRYVAKRLAAAFPDDLQAIVIATGAPKPVSHKLKTWWKRYTLPQIGSRIGLRVHRKLWKFDERRRAALRKILFPDGDDGLMPRRDLILRVPSHNGPACLAELGRIDPDVVAVYGTLIIGRKLISACPHILNIHTGLSPYYRGSDTIFWPIHNGEPELIGVTVHRLEAGVDSGPILATARPDIEPNDTEDTLFAKCVKLGADLLCEEIVRELAGTSTPQAQDLSLGHEYRSVDRTLKSQRRAASAIASGLLGSASAF